MCGQSCRLFQNPFAPHGKFRRGRLLLLPLLEADELDLDQLAMQESFANRLEHSGCQSLFPNQDDRLAVVEG